MRIVGESVTVEGEKPNSTRSGRTRTVPKSAPSLRRVAKGRPVQDKGRRSTPSANLYTNSSSALKAELTACGMPAQD